MSDGKVNNRLVFLFKRQICFLLYSVSADENKQKITTGAIVTLNVQLKREKLTNSHLRIHQSKNLNSKTCSLQGKCYVNSNALISKEYYRFYSRLFVDLHR